ncbi:Ger(x)C family spore germination protein [Paenibacillus sp. P26]|nr:Ger(x)C family spore germination protein [Paenibacillus sp. P26]
MRTMIHLRLALKWLFISGFLTLLCGCWDIKDINHRAPPLVMGLENKDGGYRAYLLIPKKSRNKTTLNVIADTGETINAVVDRIAKNMELEVDLLQLKVIVFERAIAEQGLGDSVSSLMRSREVSSKTIVAISEGSLKPLFDKLKSSSTGAGMEIYNYFQKDAGLTPQVAQTRVWQIYRSLNSYTRDVAIPLIEAGQTTAIASTGSAVIKNGKMVDRINPDETLMFNSFNGLSTQGKIEVMDHASVMIVADSLTHSSTFNGSQAILNSRLNLKVTVVETKGSPTVTMIKQELDELLTKRFERMFRKLQAKQADILGLGQFFRRQIPRDRLQYWRTDYYPYMQLNLRVNTIIQNEGLLKMKE